MLVTHVSEGIVSVHASTKVCAGDSAVDYHHVVSMELKFQQSQHPHSAYPSFIFAHLLSP